MISKIQNDIESSLAALDKELGKLDGINKDLTLQRSKVSEYTNGEQLILTNTSLPSEVKVNELLTIRARKDVTAASVGHTENYDLPVQEESCIESAITAASLISTFAQDTLATRKVELSKILVGHFPTAILPQLLSMSDGHPVNRTLTDLFHIHFGRVTAHPSIKPNEQSIQTARSLRAKYKSLLEVLSA